MKKVPDHPILMSQPMVIALDLDTKTQTRRCAGLKTINEAPEDWEIKSIDTSWTSPHGKKKLCFCVTFQHKKTGIIETVKCPYGLPGDSLWVRESWGIVHGTVGYRAKREIYKLLPEEEKGVWQSSLHMRRVDARILLEVTNIRIERLYQITQDDAINEGIDAITIELTGGPEKAWRNYENPDLLCADPRQSYFTLWDSINGPDHHRKNFWNWVVEFKKKL